MGSRTKRVVIIADLHSGHRAGLTPPSWQYRADPEDDPDMAKFGAEQRAVWDWYAKKIEELSPVDVLIVNGDAVDGKGEGSGGTEEITTERHRQVAMAAKAINPWKAPRIVMTYGTGYHTGKDDDWEPILAREVGAEKIGGHEWVGVNGLIFDVKHKIGRSSVPHGRGTPLSRAAFWNKLSAEREIEPRAHVFIRSHVHYFTYVGDGGYLAISTPALQAFGSKYGTRQCEGTVDVGLLQFDVDRDGGYSWKPHLFDLRLMAPQVIKV